jgi:hypothetical protein
MRFVGERGDSIYLSVFRPIHLLLVSSRHEVVSSAFRQINVDCMTETLPADV